MTNEFFTWAVLLTYAGATLATSLVTQLIKGVGFIDKIPTRLTSYIIALVVLIAATFFTGGLTLVSIHAPHEGERQKKRWRMGRCAMFQSTLPTRGSDAVLKDFKEEK